jgi:endonuclease YncB( thermonuclease family)
MTKRGERVYAMSRRRRAVLITLGVLGGALLFWADGGGPVSLGLPGLETDGRFEVRDLARYHGQRFSVVHVIDGDTLELDARDAGSPATRVRLLGIDAPEATSRDAPAMFYARRATERLRILANGRQVTVYLDEAGRHRGRYGRLLAYLEMPDGRFLNEVLLAEGCAYADRRFRHSYYQKYRQLEATARAMGQGLWRTASREHLPAWLQRMEPDLLSP